MVVNGKPQAAVRGDARKISDSILTEILMHIGNARLIFADISSIGIVDGRQVRNGNVMYEVGLAHSMRLPEEVLLFRSDKDELLFDVSNIRVIEYDPDGDEGRAREVVVNAVNEAVWEIDLRRNLAVQRAADSFDVFMFTALAHAHEGDGTQNLSVMTTLLGAFSANQSHNSAITQLLAMGILAMKPQTITTNKNEDLMRYQVTPFGRAVFAYLIQKFGDFDLAGFLHRTRWVRS